MIYDYIIIYIYYIHSGIIGQMYATKLCSCLDAGYGASRVTGQVMGVANVLHYAFPFIPKVRSIQVIPGRCGWMLCEFLDVWLENSILYRYWKTLCCLYFCGFQAAFFFDCHYIINWCAIDELKVIWSCYEPCQFLDYPGSCVKHQQTWLTVKAWPPNNVGYLQQNYHFQGKPRIP